MARPHRSPRRRCLPLDGWPEIDRHAWEKALEPGDILEDAGTAVMWAPATRTMICESYGRWLTYLKWRNLLDVATDIDDRVKPAVVCDYVEELNATCSAQTVFNRVTDLLKFVAVTRPESSWGWLQGVVRKLRFRRPRDPAKTVYDVTSHQLFHWGLDRAKTIDEGDCGSPLMRAVRFRDGLVVALLALRPLRRRNFVEIELGRHLIEVEGGFLLVFEAPETKNRRPLEFLVPKPLVPVLRRYLDCYRPILLDGKMSNRLWINQYGEHFSPKGFREHMVKLTAREFGRAITPHEFRSIAATTIAVDDPEYVRIIVPILGHTSFRTAEHYYIRARQLEAAGYHQRHIRSLRKKLRKMRREDAEGR